MKKKAVRKSFKMENPILTSGGKKKPRRAKEEPLVRRMDHTTKKVRRHNAEKAGPTPGELLA